VTTGKTELIGCSIPLTFWGQGYYSSYRASYRAQQMVVIIHQAVTQNLKTKTLVRLGQAG